jgi:outer membrane cobalamin receptor
MKIRFILIFYFLYWFTYCDLYAQENDTSKLFKPTIKELIDLKGAEQEEQTAGIGSFRDAKIREIPGIITVLDNQFIQNSGARELIDLLRLVPGFDFGRDVDDVIGATIRGNWAFEGKMLVMINGVQMNETGYGTFAFKGHLSLDNIEKIEIVRGPGSTIYGGAASLAVINIITKTLKYNDGVELSVGMGASNGDVSRKQGAINFGHKFNNGVSCNFSGYVNHATISNITEHNQFNQDLSYRDSSGSLNEGFITNLQIKNFNYNFIYDNYLLDISNNPSQLIMKNIINTVSYAFNPIRKLTIKPEISYKWHLPFNYYNGDRLLNDPLSTINKRTDFKLGGFYTPNKSISISTGGQYYIDESSYPNPKLLFYDSTNKIRFTNIAAFAEAQLFTKYFNITAGARYEKLNTIPEAFVPRFAITKAFQFFHIKALYSQAYKIPTIQNINAALGKIKPENIQVIEFETGIKINSAFNFNVNIFDNQIRNPIVFGYNSLTATETYRNKSFTYNRGIEAELLFKNKLINARANFSTYYNYQNDVTETFIDTIQTKELAGIPQHKATCYISFSLPKNWNINTNFVYTSARSSFVYTDSLQTILELKKVEPYNLLNVSVSKSDFILPQLKFELFFNNVLDQTYYYANTFDNGFNLLPDQRFEFTIRLIYKIGF